jgi:hypothetical protein
MFGLEPTDCLPVLPPFIGMAGMQRLAHPGEYFVVEVESAQQRGELLLQHLLADIAAAAGGCRCEGNGDSPVSSLAGVGARQARRRQRPSGTSAATVQRCAGLPPIRREIGQGSRAGEVVPLWKLGYPALPQAAASDKRAKHGLHCRSIG